MRIERATQIRILLGLMDLLERHPRWVRLLLRPLANLPVVSSRLQVLTRAYMGATAFEIHDVDPALGTIAIGGVEEVMFGRKIVHLLHTVLAQRLGEDAKNEALFDMGSHLCRWEVTQALQSGQWAPRHLAPLIFNAEILDEVERDPLMARFFEKVLNMMSRLITDEGGWGHLEFEVGRAPLRVHLSNSQEARWLGPADKPVCHFYRGIVAGYASTLSGETVHVTEVACRATGAPRCTFTVERAHRAQRVHTRRGA